MKKYDTMVFIGRFQPVHTAHKEIIIRASFLASQVIVIIGSSFQPRTYKNPFTESDRQNMLRHALLSQVDPTCTIHYVPVMDARYNDERWVSSVQESVAMLTQPSGKIGIIGYEKDSTSFYLKLFPQWKYERIAEFLEGPLHATDIRDIYFRKDPNINFIKAVVPEPVYNFLKEFKDTEEFAQIVREREFITTYKKQFEHLPYPPVFVTTDAVVTCAGHALMVKRRAEPGKGLWALPGGFLNAASDKSVQAGMLRELREETGIKVPAKVLAGSIERSHVFDAIDRSARGRTITHAFKISLDDAILPKVKGSDDAEKARWVPFAEIRSAECFEDHFDIISFFIGN